MDCTFGTVIRETITTIGTTLLSEWVVNGLTSFCNFAWYLAVTEVNTAITAGHFQNGGDIMLTLDFQRQLVIQCMKNTVLIDPGYIDRLFETVEGHK